MLTLKLIAFALIICSGVLGRDTNRGNIRHRQAAEEYGYNHPPVPEISQAIPVAVVYEDQNSREDKAIKNGITRGNNVEEVSKVTPKSEPTVTKKPSVTKVANDEQTKTTTIKQEEPKPTTYRPQKEQQIPVAIVYEPETVNYQKPSGNNVRGTTNEIQILQPALEDKETANEDNPNSSAQVNGHIGTSSMSSATERDHLNKRQRNPKPALEKQTVVEDKNAYTSSTPASNKPEKPYIRQSTQKPDTQGIATTVDSHTPSTLKMNNRQNRQRPIAEQKQTTSSADEQVYGNPPSVSKPAEIIKNKENNQQFPKRGNSTRVREVIPIVQSENVVFSHSGNFKYSYEGGDGTKAFETGELKMFDDETAGEAVSGGFSYKAKDGNEYSLSYTADENGYRPVGAHLPTPPPIPPAIARALAYLATKTTPEPVTKSIAEEE